MKLQEFLIANLYQQGFLVLILLFDVKFIKLRFPYVFLNMVPFDLDFMGKFSSKDVTKSKSKLLITSPISRRKM